MPAKEDIGRPQIIYPRNLRHMSHLRIYRTSTIDSDVSAGMGSASSRSSSCADARGAEKELHEIHASGGTWIELFYDLFFAASLSAFSNTREIANRKDLVDLAAFFTILWWTWTSQTLFDVRHSQHSKSEGVMKFLQLGTMIGYGVFEGDFSLFQVTGHGLKGGAYVPRRRSSPRTSTIAITSIFIFSRVQLGAQYLRVALRKRKDEKLISQLQNSALISAALPMIASIFWLTSLFIPESPMGVSGFFASRTSLWVIGIWVEMIGTYTMRLHRRGGFEKSHLSERYGSLTIIILGEGIIKLVSILRDISSGVGFHITSIITILSSVASFYLVFVLYFDDFSLHEKIDSLSAYNWAFTHYLLHLSLVVCLDAITSLLLFTNIFGGFQSLLSSTTESSVLEYLFNCQPTAAFRNTSTPLTVGSVTFEYNYLTTAMSRNGTELTQSQYDYVFLNLFQRIFESYNVEPSEPFLELLAELKPNEMSSDEVSHAFQLLLNQFIVSAQFFFLAGGGILLTMIPIMYWQRRLWVSNWARWVPLGARAGMGVVLVVLGLLDQISGLTLGRQLMAGSLIPTFMAAAGIVYLGDRLVVKYLQFW